MDKSTHKVEVTKIYDIQPHPNADRLDVAKVFGYTVCIKKGDFDDGDLVAYIPPDSVVPDKPEFEFLKHPSDKDTFPEKQRRITVIKLRGIYSQGLIWPVPKGTNEGDNVADILEIKHYEPRLPAKTGGQDESGPAAPTYDVDTFNRYGNCFNKCEEVIATEKIHGTGARFTYNNDRLFVGSRRNWKKENDEVCYWSAFKKHPELRAFLEARPGIVAYGEIYGRVQELRYGLKNVDLILFDLFRDGQYIDWEESQQLARDWDLPWVPIIYQGPFDEEKLRQLAEGQSQIPGADNIREGIVIKPIIERFNEDIGRLQLKIVSNAYLSGHK